MALLKIKEDDNDSQPLAQKKPESNISQTKAKYNSNVSQSSANTKPNVSSIQVNYKPEPEPGLESNISQIEDHNNYLFGNNSFLSLVGLQKKLALYVYELCKLQREKITMPLSIENAAIHAETTIASARKALQRMEQKGILIRKESKAGRGGWTRYELKKDVYQEIIHYENLNQNRFSFDSNLSQTEAKFGTKLRTELKTNSSSSSSLNKTTTINEPTETASSTELPADWQAIDFSSLASIGFNTNKLQQIYQAGVLTPEMVQDSIYAFAFDREINNKQFNSPLGFIMSLLKVKGMPYEFPQNYESPRDAALRRYMEQKQAQRERAKQLQNLLKQDAFESWLMTLSADETEKLIPPEVRKNESLRRGALLNHFQTHIWPEEEKKLADRAGT